MSKKESFKNIDLILGDCVQEMKKLDDNSVDAIVTDPPYGLKFMGKEFDDLGEGAKQKEWHKAWAVEALRILKPGGHLLAFGGTRTYHHLATAVEEAGFEVRDQMQWLYGSGFPKSLNVGKAIDKKEAKRPSKKAKDVLKVVNWFCEQLNNSGKKRSEIDKAFGTKNVAQGWFNKDNLPGRPPCVPTLDQVPKLLEVLGVKPEEVPEDIARLLLDLNGKKGQPRFELAFEREVTGEAGALWEDWETNAGGKSTKPRSGERRDKPATKEAARWEGWGTAIKPANEPIVVARKPFKDNQKKTETLQSITRFIYCPKAGKKERTAGIPEGNKHPTVKPIKVMSYLIEMVSKEKDLILDPFVGSGSTGLSAIKTNRRFIGIEKDPEYMKIAKARLKYTLEETNGSKRKTKR